MNIPISKELNSGLLAILETNERNQDYTIDLDILKQYIQESDKETVQKFIENLTKESPMLNLLISQFNLKDLF